MKRLYLLRHAKSSWDHPGITDFERRLNSRGERDAPRMGRFLKARFAGIDRVFSSPARRARDTIAAVAAAAGYSDSGILFDDRLYVADTDSVLAIIRAFDNVWSDVMIVGHNPTITELGEGLTGETIGNVPTCGVMQIHLGATDWSAAGADSGVLECFMTPKELT